VKRCPTCSRTFNEEHLSFCVEDGTPLVTVAPADDEATVVRSAPASSGGLGASGAGEPNPYQPPGSYVPPGNNGQQGKRKVWPWALGCGALFLIVVVGLVIGGKLLVPVLQKQSANANNNNYNANVNRRDDANANLNGNANSNLNSNSNSTNSNANEDVTTPPPTDQTEVLATLTDLEHEWTVANINADKKKLNRILADDYVGTLPNGKSQGKAEYLKTATRDTSIQKWNFEGLQLSLLGDRATLNGVLRVDAKDDQGQTGQFAFKFTDKFIWRDGRWQATGSEVTELKE
jgi:hypothetical protein